LATWSPPERRKEETAWLMGVIEGLSLMRAGHGRFAVNALWVLFAAAFVGWLQVGRTDLQERRTLRARAAWQLGGRETTSTAFRQNLHVF